MSLTPVSERRSVISLALLYAFRMLGLFMVLPVLTLYGETYSGATPFLLGLALGAYGCSQAILQIPFGLWSDRWGRKPVIAVGLALFALGSIVAAMSDSVYGLIFGRFLQGSGAIASAIMAMVADLTSDENRTKAMAGIGASIGIAFGVATVLGPLIAGFGGLPAVFWFTTAFALFGFVILAHWVPTPVPAERIEIGTNKAMLIGALRNPQLLRLDWGILVLHFVLMASFVVLPPLLESVVGIERGSHWYVYLGLMAGSFIFMIPLMLLAEKKRQIKAVFLLAVALLGLMQLSLWQLHTSAWALLICLFLFFVAFNLLEATLPSLLSKHATPASRGTANGVYSTSQFLGAFFGGSVGGATVSWAGPGLVFLIGAGLIGSWWLAGLFMQVPRPLTEVVIDLSAAEAPRLLPEYLKLPGVAEVSYLEGEGKARLRVDQRLFQRDSITTLE